MRRTERQAQHGEARLWERQTVRPGMDHDVQLTHDYEFVPCLPIRLSLLRVDKKLAILIGDG